MNKHAEPRRAPPSHARIALRGRFVGIWIGGIDCGRGIGLRDCGRGNSDQGQEQE
jgi:hypothetical protein